jgi:ABC-type transporter Mla maintaining outer membrane lipid asymmetry ATPase subunit MlaF
MSLAVDARGVTFGYGQELILKGVTLKVGRGEILLS